MSQNHLVSTSTLDAVGADAPNSTPREPVLQGFITLDREAYFSLSIFH